jgi:hypothetical protein
MTIGEPRIQLITDKVSRVDGLHSLGQSWVACVRSPKPHAKTRVWEAIVQARGGAPA